MKFLLALLIVGITSLPVTALAMTLDESPAEAGEWGYRPEPDSSPVLNPPGFSWRPIEEAERYQLQISDASDFSDLIFENSNVPWSSYCPMDVLQPGTYFWRYRAINNSNEKTGWSTTREFQIQESAVKFPPPTREMIQASLSEGHPRLFLRQEDIPRLKELAAGELSDHWAKVLEYGDRILQNPPETTPPEEYPDDMVRRSEEWKTLWWGNRKRTINVLDKACNLAFIYTVSGEEKYARGARDLLLDFCEWDPLGATGYLYNDEAGMPAMYLACRTATFLWPYLNEDEKSKVAEVTAVRANECYHHLLARQHLWKPYASHSNRAWHFLGEAAITFYDYVPEAKQWLDFALTVFYTAYPVWGDSSGGWHEGIAYWSSYQSKFLYWGDIMRAAFDIDVFRRPFYGKTGYYGMYLMPPGTMTGGFADQSVKVQSTSIRSLMLNLAIGAQNPHWMWFGEQTGATLGNNYMGFLRATRALKIESRPPTDVPASRCFQGTGIAVMNTNLVDGKNNIQLHFKSSPFGTQSHGYNANNAFLLNIDGEPVFIRSGKRDIYGSDHHKNWMWSTKSDNAIMVNGIGQMKHSPKAKGIITNWETSKAVDVVEGEAAEAYDTTVNRWTRRMIFFKPDIIVVHDILDATGPSSFQWLLHAPESFEIDKNRVSYLKGPKPVQVRFLIPNGLSITQTDQFDHSPAEWTDWNLVEWHLKAETNDAQQHMEFLTIMTIGESNAEAEMKRSDDEIVLTLKTAEDEEAIIELSSGEFSVHLGDYYKTFFSSPSVK